MEPYGSRITNEEVCIGDILKYTYEGVTTYAKVNNIVTGPNGTQLNVSQCDYKGNVRFTSREIWNIPDPHIKIHIRSKGK